MSARDSAPVAAYTTRVTDALILTSTMNAWNWEPADPPVPHLARLFAMSALVWRHGGDEDQVIAMLVHDTADNFDYASVPLRVRAQFGPRTATIVEALLERPRVNASDWRATAEAHVERAAGVDADAALVLACAAVHELTSIAVECRAVGAVPGEDACWYHRAMRDALASRLPDSLVTELDAQLEARWLPRSPAQREQSGHQPGEHGDAAHQQDVAREVARDGHRGG